MERTVPAGGNGQKRDDRTLDLPARQAQLPAALREFHRAVLRAFLSSEQPPRESDLRTAAAELGLELTAAFGQLAAADLVHVASGGRIAVAYPFAGRDAGVRVRLAGGPEVWSMCAIDALGIPQMTGRHAVITGTDPVSGEPVRVESGNGSLSWQPGSVVVLVANNGRGGSSAECTCPLITFHTSEQNARDCLRSQPGATGSVLTQEKANQLAGRIFAGLLGEHAPEAAECP